MLDILVSKIEKIESKERQLAIVREFLQILILKILADKRYFTSLAFIGGTCMRIVYDLKRYSEDLDFSVYNASNYNFNRLLGDVTRELELYGFKIDIKHKEDVVDSCFINFKEILQKLKLSIAKEQKLSIKLEIDTKPPLGSDITTTLINDEFLINIVHYDSAITYVRKNTRCFVQKICKGKRLL